MRADGKFFLRPTVSVFNEIVGAPLRMDQGFFIFLPHAKIVKDNA
jgi:hypothetical protein